MPSAKKQYPENLAKFTRRMLAKLEGTYPNFRPNEKAEQRDAYTEAIARMVEEFGQGRTAAAIQRACDLVPDFVPTPGKIREFMPTATAKIETCTLCHPSGYVMVYEGKTARTESGGGNDIDPKFGAARRCDHKGGFFPVTEQRAPGADGRQYGVNHVEILWKLHAEKRARLKRNLTAREQAALLDELDRLIKKHEDETKNPE